MRVSQSGATLLRNHEQCLFHPIYSLLRSLPRSLPLPNTADFVSVPHLQLFTSKIAFLAMDLSQSLPRMISKTRKLATQPNMRDPFSQSFTISFAENTTCFTVSRQIRFVYTSPTLGKPPKNLPFVFQNKILPDYFGKVTRVFVFLTCSRASIAACLPCCAVRAASPPRLSARPRAPGCRTLCAHTRRAAR